MQKKNQGAATFNRRAFLQRASAIGLAVSAGGILPAGRSAHASDLPQPLFDYAVERPAAAPAMVIARGEDARLMVRAAMDRMGGMDRYIQKGDVVLLKPNIAFDRAPEVGATVSPEVISILITLCREAGARRVIVSDNPVSNFQSVLERAQIGSAVNEAGGEILPPHAGLFRPLDAPGLLIHNASFAYGMLEGIDKLINIPMAKDHGLSGASISLKNWMGLLGRGRARFHQDINTMMTDLGATVRPTLTILDATRLLMTNGPTGGSPDDVKPGNIIAVSTDQLAIDAYGCHLLEKDLNRLPYLAMAEQRGIGVADWNRLSPVEVAATA